jgi:hypothetical protein
LLLGSPHLDAGGDILGNVKEIPPLFLYPEWFYTQSSSRIYGIYGEGGGNSSPVSI